MTDELEPFDDGDDFDQVVADIMESNAHRLDSAVSDVQRTGEWSDVVNGGRAKLGIVRNGDSSYLAGGYLVSGEIGTIAVPIGADWTAEVRLQVAVLLARLRANDELDPQNPPAEAELDLALTNLAERLVPLRDGSQDIRPFCGWAVGPSE
jgi:hypothetical protein